MADNSKTFEQAATTDGALLSTYDIVTPVASTPDGQNTFVFIMRTDGPDGVVSSGFQEFPTETVESYTNINNISLHQLSPEGMNNYMIGAVQDGLNLLSDEARIAVIAGGMDIGIAPDPDSPEAEGFEMPDNGMSLIDVQRIEAGNFDADFAHEALVRNGLVEALGELYNDPNTNVDLNVLDRVYGQANIARDLPNYSADLATQLEEGGPPATPESLEAAQAVLRGDGPTPNMDLEMPPVTPD